MPKKKAPAKLPYKSRKVPRKASPRATVVTVHHAPGAHPLMGSDERRIILSRRALQLKTYGYTLPAIAEKLTEEFELADQPAKTTVFEWIESALAETLKGAKEDADHYIAIHKQRAETIIRGLMPYACDAFVVERTRRIDGCEVKVIDEKVLDERIKAAGEIRKQGESVLKALGVFKPAGEGDNSVTPDGIKMFVIQTVNNHIARPGELIDSQRAQTVLELRGGDEVIDNMGKL